MSFVLSRVSAAVVACVACAWSVCTPALAQDGQAIEAAVVPGERLSDWLLRNAGPGADTTALHWKVSAERAAQSQLRQAVLAALYQRPRVHGQATGSLVRLADWLMALPLTGRLTLAIADARWLQSSPDQDPILQDGHQVVLLPRPTTVTVLTEAGKPCSATHVSGALVKDYLRACSGGDSSIGDDLDWAWLAQPDGRTARFGIAPWSLEPQDEPGPGAWIWAPGRDSGVARAVSDNLVRFLATQLPGVPAPGATAANRVALPLLHAEPPRKAQLTASDWGEIGLLQTPSARMEPTGAVRLHLGRVAPYTRGNLMMQPLDWLEAGFRYSDVANRLGNAAVSNQSYKDKSLDVKIRLHQESDIWPEIAVGVRDLGGTGLFSGEYLVASKRWGDWDASLGLGWGYLGARGNIRNPLSMFGSRFNTRPGNTTVTGGTATLNSMFRGPTALFGGVQWHSPSDPWILKFELDGNGYQNEPLANNQPSRSPLNVGAVYRYSPFIDFSVGLERGNRLMLGMTLHGALQALYSPKVLDPVQPVPPPQGAAPLSQGALGTTARNLELFTGWSVRSIVHQPGSTTVVAETDGALHLQERIERAITVLDRDAPSSSTRLLLQLQERGLPMSQIEVDRAEWVLRHTRTEPVAFRLATHQVLPGQPQGAPLRTSETADSVAVWRGRQPGFSAEWGPSYGHILGGPNGFLLYQIGLQARLEHRFSDQTWLAGDFNLRVLDNYDKFTYTAPSNLPRVRTLQREFVTTSRLTMPLLQLTHVGDLGNGHYVSAYGGMLEFMYGGVGAEWLYRPWQGRLAWGVDVNHVRQRDFQQGFQFRDYRVSTGHASMYWDTGWNDVQVKLSAGRYLAGDIGATLDLKRVFSNGVALGAWATKTNVSAAQFGEGSFDKGIYVNLPFDVMLPRSTPGSGMIAWNPLTRDGGARLTRRFPLYDLTRQRDARALAVRSSSPPQTESAADLVYVAREPRPGLLDTLGDTTTTLGRQFADVPASTWWWLGGAVLASSLLDKPVDKWALDHSSGRWDRAGTVANGLTYGLAIGAGLLFTGIAGEGAASTGETAIKAAAYTMGASLATRYVFGRARPSDGLGRAEFRGFRSSAWQSGFPSNHVAAAFALVTPFAQQHDMPWLYGVAAATAFGRVQKRQHWLSDTVAGAAIGYSIGSLLTEQQRGDKAMRLSVTPQSVVASWAFD